MIKRLRRWWRWHKMTEAERQQALSCQATTREALRIAHAAITKKGPLRIRLPTDYKGYPNATHPQRPQD